MPSTLSNKCFTNPDDLAACRALLSDGSRTFLAAARVLPRRVHEPATALYAFCRIADDAVDVDGGQIAAVARLQKRLDRAYAGRPVDTPVDRAFADVVAHFDMPRAIPEALLEGLAWDVEGRRYKTLSDLYEYAARVAGTVGVMMAVLMGRRSPEALARACDLGVAMQLSNIARDVGEDARTGRIYLPEQWFAEAGLDADAWLRDPAASAPLRRIVQRLLTAADALYARAESGIAMLPADARPGIFAARYLYAEIGNEVARNGFDSVSSRAVVGGSQKLALLPKALGAAVTARANESAAPLPEVRFLVDAAARAEVAAPKMVSWWNLGEQAVRMADIWASLEKRERLEHFGHLQPSAVRIRREGVQ